MWGYRGGLSCYLLLTQSVGWELGREGLFWFISSLLSCLAACSSLSFLFHLFGEQLPVHVPSKQFKRRWVEVIGPGIEGWLFGGHKCAFVFWVSRKLMSCLAGEKGEVGRHKGEEHMHIYSQHHPPKIAVASHSLTVVTKQSCTFPKHNTEIAIFVSESFSSFPSWPTLLKSQHWIESCRLTTWIDDGFCLQWDIQAVNARKFCVLTITHSLWVRNNINK